MDGLSMMARSLQVQPRTLVLLITGTGDFKLAQLALDLGAYDFLVKPFDRAAIVHSVRQALQVYRLRRQLQHGRTTLAKLRRPAVLLRAAS